MNVIFLRQAAHFIKRADGPLRSKIQSEISRIAENPRIGELLASKLAKVRAHHFGFVRTQYRIAYRVESNVIIIYIASRENFYRDLERNI